MGLFERHTEVARQLLSCDCRLADGHQKFQPLRAQALQHRVQALDKRGVLLIRYLAPRVPFFL